MKDYAEKKRNPSMDPNIIRKIEKDKTIQKIGHKGWCANSSLQQL
jgi:hypothetical protein